MNNDRRKEIGQAIKDTEALSQRWADLLSELAKVQEDASDLKDTIEQIKSDEEEYKDNMPANMQQSDRYYAAEAATEKLDEAMTVLDALIDLNTDEVDLEQVVTDLDEAKA